MIAGSNSWATRGTVWYASLSVSDDGPIGVWAGLLCPAFSGVFLFDDGSISLDSWSIDPIAYGVVVAMVKSIGFYSRSFKNVEKDATCAFGKMVSLKTRSRDTTTTPVSMLYTPTLLGKWISNCFDSRICLHDVFDYGHNRDTQKYEDDSWEVACCI